jgi:CBS domain containing-hemolysin-like protein
MTGLLLVLLVLLVLLNGLFVAAEIGLVRSRRARLEVMANEGARGAAKALEQLDRLAEYIAACQVGITLCSIGIGFLGEPSLKTVLEPIFGGFSDAVAATIAVVVAFVIVTSVHITFGELTPKLVAIPRAEGAARRLAGPLAAFRTVSGPFTVGLTAVANRIARLFGGGSLAEEHTSEDIKIIISQSQTGGSLDAGEAVMLSGVFHLHEQQAREVMTPIPAVVTVNASENVEEALQRCVSSGHTRLIVIEDDNPDRVRGVVHNNSLARLYMNAGGDASVEPAIRDVPIFPETKPLDDLLAELQRQRSSIAVVSDEYGRTVGIVTIEDILEEVVGEIEDETDPRAASMRKLADGDWYVRGHVSLGDLEDVGIRLPVSSDAFNSIGGYVFSELGRLPKRGDRVIANGYQIRVESVRENRILAVRIHEAPAATPSSSAPGTAGEGATGQGRPAQRPQTEN